MLCCDRCVELGCADRDHDRRTGSLRVYHISSTDSSISRTCIFLATNRLCDFDFYFYLLRFRRADRCVCARARLFIVIEFGSKPRIQIMQSMNQNRWIRTEGLQREDALRHAQARARQGLEDRSPGRSAIRSIDRL